MKTVLKQCSALYATAKGEISGQDQIHTILDSVNVTQRFKRKNKYINKF